MARIGINGFGRIGRYLVRLMAERNEFPVVINARADNASLAHLFKYDSVHHTFKGTVGHDENGIIINGTHIAVTRCKPNEWQWKDYGVDLVVESTGTIKKRAGLAEHMACGAKKVIITAPAKDEATPTFVMGVNHMLYRSDMRVVSNASCTTNCLAPMAKVLHDNFGIVEGLMTTVHSTTGTQKTVDGASKKDWRGGRAAAGNIIPSSTGAAKACALVIPELKGKLTGMSFRVPTLDVSVVDLTVSLAKPTTYEEICKAVKAACEGEMKGIMDYTDEDVVSSDFYTDPHTSIFDAKAGIMLNDHFVKLVSWYDNEWGYSNKLLDLIGHMAEVDAQ